MLELSSRPKEKIKINDVIYEVDRPTIGLSIKLQERLKIHDTSDSIKILAAYVQDLGLPKAVIADLDLKDFLSIVEYLTPKKK